MNDNIVQKLIHAKEVEAERIHAIEIEKARQKKMREESKRNIVDSILAEVTELNSIIPLHLEYIDEVPFFVDNISKGYHGYKHFLFKADVDKDYNNYIRIVIKKSNDYIFRVEGIEPYMKWVYSMDVLYKLKMRLPIFIENLSNQIN